MMLALGLSYMAFILLRYIPYIPNFLRVFIMNVCWILSYSFSAAIERIVWFLAYVLLTWCIVFIDWHVLNSPCITGVNPTRSWCMILLICCLIWFTGILLRIFICMLIRDIVLYFSCSELVCLWYQDNAGLIKWVWKFSLLFNFWDEFKEDWG